MSRTLIQLFALLGTALLLGLGGCGMEEPASATSLPASVIDGLELRFLDAERGATPLASAYTQRVEGVAQQGPVYFNGAMREKLLHVTLVGVDVVFDPHDAGHPLNDYDERLNLGALTILAERLVVRGALELPGTTLTVYARELVFEDVEGEAPARIDTSPRGLAAEEVPAPQNAVNDRKRARRVAAGDGVDGEDAGDVTLVIGRFTADGDAKRIRMHGGDGTAGGKAAAGHGFGQVHYLGTPAERLRAVRKAVRHMAAIPGGKPGDGGSAGELVTTLPRIETLADRAGGQPGPATAGARGGGKPMWRVDLRGASRAMRRAWPTKDGPAAAAREGAPGTRPAVQAHATDDPFAWAHPEALRVMVEYLEDVYLAGHHDEATEICLRALAWIKTVSVASGSESYAFAAFRARLMTLAQRLTNGLDYFGHPPGWVPLLSFEATYATFRQEAKAAVRTMLLTHWMERFWDRQEDRQAALREVIAGQEARIEDARGVIRRVRALLPVLEVQQAEITAEVARLRMKLAAVERRIQQAFEREKAWERVGSAVLTGLTEALGIGAFLPTGEGARKNGARSKAARGASKAHIGLALAAGVAAGIGDYIANAPARVSGSAGSDAFQGVLEEEEAAAARERLANLDPTTATDHAVYLDGVLALADAVRKGTEAFLRERMQASLEGAADYETASELHARIEGNASYRAFFDDLVRLLTQKQIFAEQVVRAQDGLDTALADIAEATWMIDVCHEALRKNAIDTTSRTVLAGMRRRAKERLNRYQYHLAKAFEYRVMEAAPVDFQRNRLYERIEAMFDLEGAGDVDVTELATFSVESPLVERLVDVYQDILSEMVDLILTGMQTNRFTPGDWPYRLTLTPEELDELNANGVVAIDLPAHGMILPSDRNARIKHVEVVGADEATRFRVERAPEGREANVDITFEPPERSWILWGDEAYGVDYRRDTQMRIDLWAYTWSAAEAVGQMVPRSRTTASLLRMLVPDTKDLERVHFHPSAHGSLVIRKETASDVEIRVERLALSIVIEKNKVADDA